MSVWTIPAIVVWAAVILLLALRLCRRFGGSAYYLIGRWFDWTSDEALRAVDQMNCPRYPPNRSKALRWRELPAWSLRYLTALGGFAATLLVFGIAVSAIGAGGVGTVLLMVFPGSLLAARVYLRILGY